MFDVVAVAAGRNSTVIKDEKSKDVGSWLRDKAKAVEHLAADMTVPEAKRQMEVMAEIYRRMADRRAARSARKKSQS
jgi:hypothetical protein